MSAAARSVSPARTRAAASSPEGIECWGWTAWARSAAATAAGRVAGRHGGLSQDEVRAPVLRVDLQRLVELIPRLVIPVQRVQRDGEVGPPRHVERIVFDSLAHLSDGLVVTAERTEVERRIQPPRVPRDRYSRRWPSRTPRLPPSNRSRTTRPWLPAASAGRCPMDRSRARGVLLRGLPKTRSS